MEVMRSRNVGARMVKVARVARVAERVEKAREMMAREKARVEIAV